MMAGPAAIAEIISSSFGLDAPPEPLDEVVLRIIREHPEWGGVPEDKASLYLPKVQQILLKNWNTTMQEGKQPRFAFNSVSSYKIQGACFVEPRDTEEVKGQKRRRFYWVDYYEHLRTLNPESFEKLCARVLALLGVAQPHQTPYRKDQGIDFFGKMSVGDLTGHGPLYPIFESRLIFWLIGQAKHYLHSKVSTPDIRELVGSTLLGRSRTFPSEDILKNLEIRTCDPVIMLFFTTGQVSSDGWLLCRKAGIAADGWRDACVLPSGQTSGCHRRRTWTAL
jgi:Restriction endonuclease